jgi:Xaa-Pro dipeptidase
LTTANGSLINEARLWQEFDAADLDAIVVAAPENTRYLSGVLIRTQISIRDRLALVVQPRAGEPTFLVCDIEESHARTEGEIADVRTYVEFAESPISALIRILRERGLEGKRIGIEERFLSHAYHAELLTLPATYVGIDVALERTRAIKTPTEIEAITNCYRETEAAIRAAWAHSKAGDTERQVADRMVEEIKRRGADGQRHMTLAVGENTIHPHGTPGNRQLAAGEILLTDFGGTWGGFSSDMARMGIVGSAPARELDEYERYRAAYVEVLQGLGPGLTAGDVFRMCAAAFESRGLPMTFPHVGHGVGRSGGHEFPILHPGNDAALEENMLIALEPGLRASPTRRYHIEDLVLITATGGEILTDWRSTESMIPISL